MNSKFSIIVSLTLLASVLFGCADDSVPPSYSEADTGAQPATTNQLKEKFADDFLIGAAVDHESYQTHVSSVSFWGVADDNTWLSEFDSGRADFPLLFDTAHKPKSAFHAIMDL